jgi:serine phosphatase RsbU (regulator of sigma subunit)
LRQCRLGTPPPFLRSGRLAQWTGKPEGPAGAFIGEHELQEDALLVVATDGVAHLPTKGRRPLWDSPELRTLLGRATDPAEVVDMLAQRAAEPAAGERIDDRLAVAVML